MKKKELETADGKEGRPAYIAYNDQVYEVTSSKMWKEGVHMNRHKAGQDLSDFMALAPHGAEVLERMTVVGPLEKGQEDIVQERKHALRKLYQKFHPHPIMIHNPMGLLPFAAIMQLIFVLTGVSSFEKAAFYCLIGAVVTAVPATLAGIASWWINYEMALTSIFKSKLYFSLLLLIMGSITVLIRWFVPSVAYDGGLLFVLYHALFLGSVPVILYVAYNGGKITWPA